MTALSKTPVPRVLQGDRSPSGRPRGHRPRLDRWAAVASILVLAPILLGCLAYPEEMQTLEWAEAPPPGHVLEGRWYSSDLVPLARFDRGSTTFELALPSSWQVLGGRYEGEELVIPVHGEHGRFELRLTTYGGELATVSVIWPQEENPRAWSLERLSAEEYALARAKVWARVRFEEAMDWLVRKL